MHFCLIISKSYTSFKSIQIIDKRLVRKSLTRLHCSKKVLSMRKLKRRCTRMTLICCLVGIGISTFWISIANASNQNPQTAKSVKVKMLQKWNMLESFRNRRDSFWLNVCLELNYFNSDKRVVRDDRFTLTNKILCPYLPFSAVEPCQGFSEKSFLKILKNGTFWEMKIRLDLES